MSAVSADVIVMGDPVAEHPYRGKRAVDLFILSLVAIPALLLGSVCALAVRLTSRGPVFFRQERAGLNGESFMVWKFRSMANGNNPIFPEDCHITRVGAVLRRLSLDELPQLINVAVGEMSIVGPRPAMVYQSERYSDFQMRRLAVRPGLTGLAQVSGRNSISWGSRIEHDVRYVEMQSPRVDLALVFRTFTTVITGQGIDGHPTDDPLSAPSADMIKPVAGGTVGGGIEDAVELQLIDLTASGVESAEAQMADAPTTDGLTIDLRTVEALRDRAGAIVGDESLPGPATAEAITGSVS